MNARNKVVLNHAHSGWIDVETVLKAANSEWPPADFAEQRRNEGFLVRCVPDSELSGWLMRWDDAYDWIYRYASPVRARDILERALNIEKAAPQDVGFDYPLYDFLSDGEEEELELALEDFEDDEDEDANEIILILQEMIEDDEDKEADSETVNG